MQFSSESTMSCTQEHQIIVKTLMPSLKTLAIEVSYIYEGYVDWIIKLLNLFPCLEALYIRVS